MKILWIGPWHSDVACHQCRGPMAQALRDLGHEVGTVVVGDKGSWRTGGYDQVEYVPKRRTPAGKLMNQAMIARLLMKYDGDVIILGEKASHLALAPAVFRRLRKSRVKIAIDVRTLPVPAEQPGPNGCTTPPGNHLRYRQLRMGFPFADGWTAITKGVADEVRRQTRPGNIPHAVWPSAVDRAFIDLNPPSSRRIAQYGHGINLIYLGSLARSREMDLPVRGMALVRNSDIGLHLVGDGDQAGALRQLTGEIGLSDRVHLHGPVPYSEVPEILSSCDAGILPLRDCPTWSTSSALKLFEYMAMGLPVLVSDIASHRELLQGRPFGFFMSEYTPRGFSSAAERMCEMPKDRLSGAGNQAREFVRENHTWDCRARAITEFLNRLTER